MYAVAGVLALVVLLIAVGVASDFLTEIIGTVYPAFVSLRLAQVMIHFYFLFLVIIIVQ